VVIDQGAVPAYPHARETLDKKYLTRGSGANLEYAKSLGPLVGEPELLLRDPQTSGGLLIAVRPGETDKLLDTLRRVGYPHAARIGAVETGAGLRLL